MGKYGGTEQGSVITGNRPLRAISSQVTAFDVTTKTSDHKSANSIMTFSEYSRVVSAPGKVFLAGGYLVLDRAYTALVFGLDARIHVRIQKASSTVEQIVVNSPQFKHSKWIYEYSQSHSRECIGITENRT